MTAAALVHQFIETCDKRGLPKPQRDLQAVKLLIVGKLGYQPLSPAGASFCSGFTRSDTSASGRRRPAATDKTAE